MDACRDAVVHDVHNWAWALIRGLRAIGYEYTSRCDILIPVDIASVLLLLDAPALQENGRVLIFALELARLRMPPFAHMFGGLPGLHYCHGLLC